VYTYVVLKDGMGTLEEKFVLQHGVMSGPLLGLVWPQRTSAPAGSSVWNEIVVVQLALPHVVLANGERMPGGVVSEEVAGVVNDCWGETTVCPPPSTEVTVYVYVVPALKVSWRIVCEVVRKEFCRVSTMPVAVFVKSTRESLSTSVPQMIVTLVADRDCTLGPLVIDVAKACGAKRRTPAKKIVPRRRS
jgi:hypothetical protein